MKTFDKWRGLLDAGSYTKSMCTLSTHRRRRAFKNGDPAAVHTAFLSLRETPVLGGGQV